MLDTFAPLWKDNPLHSPSFSMPPSSLFGRSPVRRSIPPLWNHLTATKLNLYYTSAHLLWFFKAAKANLYNNTSIISSFILRFSLTSISPQASMFLISWFESKDAWVLTLEDAITMLKRKFLLGDPIIIYELHTEMEEVIIWIRDRDKQNARDEVIIYSSWL